MESVDKDETDIIISNRNLDELPELVRFTWMKSLVASFNKLPSAFTSNDVFERLRHLDLSHNNLQGSLPSLALNAPYLEHLNISHNKLIDLSIARGCTMLVQLHADSNHLHSFLDCIQTVSEMALLKMLTLFDNPCVRMLPQTTKDAVVTSTSGARVAGIARLRQSVAVHARDGSAVNTGFGLPPLEAAVMLILYACEQLQTIVLESPFKLATQQRKLEGTLALADGGRGQNADITPTKVAGCIVCVTSALLKAAKEWCRSDDGCAFVQLVQSQATSDPADVPMGRHGQTANKTHHVRHSQLRSSTKASAKGKEVAHQSAKSGLARIDEESGSDVESIARHAATNQGSRRGRDKPRRAVGEGEIDAAAATTLEEGYRIMYSGRVFAGAESNEHSKEEDGGAALRVRGDGTATCRWFNALPALDVTIDEKAVAALSRYDALMTEAGHRSAAPAPRAYHVVGHSSESARKQAWRTIDVDGFGVGRVVGNNGAVVLQLFEDGSGYHADSFGIPMRRWNQFGEIIYVAADFTTQEESSDNVRTSRSRLLRSTSTNVLLHAESPPRSKGEVTARYPSSQSHRMPRRDHASRERNAHALSTEIQSDSKALRESILADLHTDPSWMEDDNILSVPSYHTDVSYVATAQGCGYLLGKHMGVVYNLVRHELKLHIARKAFRYELAIASSTASTAGQAHAADGTDNMTPMSSGSAGLRPSSSSANFPISLGAIRPTSELSISSLASSGSIDRPIATPRFVARPQSGQSVDQADAERRAVSQPAIAEDD